MCVCSSYQGIIPNSPWYSIICYFYLQNITVFHRDQNLHMDPNLQWREGHQELKQFFTTGFCSIFCPYLHSKKKTVEPSSWLKCREHKYLFYFLVSVCSIAIGYLQHIFVINSSYILWQKESCSQPPWCPSNATIHTPHLPFPKPPPFKWAWEKFFLKQQFSSFSEPRGIQLTDLLPSGCCNCCKTRCIPRTVI